MNFFWYRSRVRVVNSGEVFFITFMPSLLSAHPTSGRGYSLLMAPGSLLLGAN